MPNHKVDTTLLAKSVAHRISGASYPEFQVFEAQAAGPFVWLAAVDEHRELIENFVLTVSQDRVPTRYWYSKCPSTDVDMKMKATAENDGQMAALIAAKPVLFDMHCIACGGAHDLVEITKAAHDQIGEDEPATEAGPLPVPTEAAAFGSQIGASMRGGVFGEDGDLLVIHGHGHDEDQVIGVARNELGIDEDCDVSVIEGYAVHEHDASQPAPRHGPSALNSRRTQSMRSRRRGPSLPDLWGVALAPGRSPGAGATHQVSTRPREQP